MTRWKIPGAMLGLASGALLFSSLGATSLEQLDLQGLTADADVVVIGQIISSQGQYSDGEFFTLLDIQVNQSIVGAAPDQLQIRVPGGSAVVNGIRVGETIAGLAPVVSERDFALFLSADQTSGVHEIVGFSQGQLAVRVQDGQQMLLVPGQNVPMPVEDFVQQVSAYAAERN